MQNLLAYINCIWLSYRFLQHEKFVFFCYFCAWIPFSRQQSTFHMRQSVVDISILSFCPNKSTHTQTHSILIASQPIFAIIILGFESIRFGITSCHHKTIHWILSCSLLVYMCVGSFLNIFFFVVVWYMLWKKMIIFLLCCKFS